MPRIIFKCPYIKPGTEKAAAHLNNYVRYVATRDGVEKLTPDKAALPATKKQRAMVERYSVKSYVSENRQSQGWRWGNRANRGVKPFLTTRPGRRGGMRAAGGVNAALAAGTR